MDSRIEGFKEGYKEGYEIGQADERKEIIEMIEEMMQIDQMNPEMTDEALKKERLFTLRELKQKIKGDK